MPRTPPSLLARILCAAAFLLASVYLVDFLFRPIPVLGVRVSAGEPLIASISLDRGDGYGGGDAMATVLQPDLSTAIITYVLPPEPVAGFMITFRSPLGTPPSPILLRSVSLGIPDAGSHTWDARGIAADFLFRGADAVAASVDGGTAEALSVVPSGPEPSLKTSAPLPTPYSRGLPEGLARWRLLRTTALAASLLLLLALVAMPDGAFPRLAGRIGETAGALARRWRWLSSSPVRTLAALAALAVVFALVFPAVSLRAHLPWNEPLEDLLVTQFEIEGIVNGTFPLWNPFVNGGQPFTWNCLTMNVSQVNVLHAAAVAAAGLLTDLDVSRASKLVLLAYMAILALGLFRLIRHLVPAAGSGAAVVLAVAGGAIYASWWAGGLYITVLSALAFVPFCLLHLHRLVEAPTAPGIWRLVLPVILLAFAAGVYAVPLGIVLLCYAAALLLLATADRRRGVLRCLAGNPGTTALAAGTLLLSVAWKAWLYATESGEIVRIGRDLGSISFGQFLDAGQGLHHAARVASYFTDWPSSSTFAGTVTLFLLGCALLDRAFWRIHRATIAFTLFVGSVVLMERSPFLLLVYGLVPWLRRFMYWGIYYDVLLLCFVVFVAEGFASFVRRFSAPKAWAAWAVLVAGFAALHLAGISHRYSLWHLLALAPVILLMSFPSWRGRPSGVAVAGAAVLLVVCSEFGFHLAGQLRDVRISQLSYSLADEPALHRAISKDYPFPARREIQRKRDFELWGFAFPMIARRMVWDPDNRYVTTRDRMAVDEALDAPGRLAVRGVTRDILRLVRDVRVAGSRAEMLETLARDPLGDCLLVEDPAEAARVAALLRPGAGALRAEHRVVSFDPNTLAVDATVSGPCALVWSDSWHRDWRATVDGRDAPVLRADGDCKAVLIETAGSHRIEFRFAPTAFVVLFALGNLAPLVPLGFLWGIRRRTGGGE